MKKIIFSISVLLFVLPLIKCKKNNIETSKPIVQELKNDPPPEDTLIFDESTNYYLDGSSVSTLENTSIVWVIAHQTLGKNAYGFSSVGELTTWANTLSTPIKNSILEAITTSAELEGDSTLDPPSVSKLPETTLVKKRMVSAGYKLFDLSNLTGDNSYHYGWTRDLGSWRNRATSMWLSGSGTQVFCMDRKFKGVKFYAGTLVYVQIQDLTKFGCSNDIESSF